MKNLVIICLLAVIAFLFLDNKKAKKLANEAKQKLNSVLPSVQDLAQDITGPGGIQPLKPNSEFFYVEPQPTGTAPMIDNPVVNISTPSDLVLSKQLIMIDTPPVYAYTPTTKRHGAFKI